MRSGPRWMAAIVSLLLVSLAPAASASPADVVQWAAAFAEGPAACGALPVSPGGPPFSFVYAGIPSAALLRTWRRAAKKSETPERARQTITWADPATHLIVTATVVAWKDFPAVEWVLRFENAGSRDTPILEQVEALDARLAIAGQPLVLDQINGDHTDETSFVPMEREVKPGDTVSLMPSDGRPSSGTFPFLNVQSGGEGFFTAIGWTGRWAAGIARKTDGSGRMTAGLEKTHLVLHPGESIRTPRILLMAWSGDRREAHNAFRRLMLAHYYPRVGGKPIVPALGAQTFNSWAGGHRPEWATEQGQIAAAKVNQAIGADTLWMDAGWFEGNFPNGAGNWFPRPKDFPRGMRPVGDACRKLGIRHLMWYEPERVVRGTQIAREHPEWVLGGENGGMLNLGDPRARRWMADLLCAQIAEYGLSCWRTDFNMDPLPYWRAADAPDRQGMTEIRYVEGLYALWDELRARNPGIYIDMCASGGRRIDLETVMRSVVQTRSDTECAPGRADWEQSQTYGIHQYLPLAGAFGWDAAAYDIRSTATAGYLGEWDLLDPAFPAAEVRACFEEVKANRPYWYGDFYPLTPWTMAPDRWMAWQLHRPDLDAGIVLAFRHKECPDAELAVTLQGIDAARTYAVTFIDDAHQATKREMTGAELANLTVHVAKARGSVLVRYAGRK